LVDSGRPVSVWNAALRLGTAILPSSVDGLFKFKLYDYLLIFVVVVVYLIVKKEEQKLRTVLLGTLLTFYIGYALYIIFSATSPSKILANEFTRDFSGGWLTRTGKN